MKLIIDKRGKKRLCEDDVVHTDLGIVDLKDVEDGVVKSHLGHEFRVVAPRLLDIYEKLPRTGSLILRKDIGTILANTGLKTGDVVVDAGTGTGALAVVLASIVMPTGMVYTYEIREDFAEIAKKNIAKAGLSDYCAVKQRDIQEGIDENPDVITLDLAEPWNLTDKAYDALKSGGAISAYTPYIEHARDVNQGFKAAGFNEVRTIETIEREMEFRKQGSRPKTRMPSHTAYLTFARKY
ncbi:MAG: tRNA (adenine-N1)-methyltransferase [Candidatus Hydrothermarchaeota archaeon]|nr:tRNA (adenine-N1)-methyltransferase [Candidatus Hydrothermarchaeota archaeon]